MDITRAIIMATRAIIMAIMDNTDPNIIKDIILGNLRASMEEEEEVTPLLYTETEEIPVLDSALALGQACWLGV